MVYSPGIVLIRDDNGEWRSPVEVNVLSSAAVNAGEIRRGLEMEERLRKESAEMVRVGMERVEIEFWKKKGEERRKEMAERKAAKKKKEEETAKLKEEQANLQKEMLKTKGMDKGKTKDSDKDEPFVGQEKAVAGVENENEKGEEVEVENPTDSPDSRLGCGSDSQLKGAEEFRETLIQDDQPQPEALPEVNQKPTSSSTIVHPLLPPTQPLQVPDLKYALALENAKFQIQQIMYARISRILHLFQLHQTPYLILGSFGTGVFENRIDLIASIFADLLIKPGGRFKDVFKTVVFAILGKETLKVFSEVFYRANKQLKAQRERICVFRDSSEDDGDVKEGDEEKAMRMMKWNGRRRRRNPLM